MKYEYDPFDDGSNNFVKERHMEKEKEFIKKYAQDLHMIEQTIDESLSKVWDFDTDPIELDIKPYEQTAIIELAKTDNKLFSKIIIVFSSLCQEIKKLKSIAETKFYPAFLCYEIYSDGKEGEVQIQMGRMISLIVDLEKFVFRCNNVLQNLMCQLASLYIGKSKIYRTTFQDVHFTTVFRAIGDLLMIFVTLDEVIGQNNLFHEHWAKYKRMSKLISSNPEQYQTNGEKLLQFEKLLLGQEGKLFSGLIYQDAVSFEFDFPGVVEVKNNEAFRKEFATNLQILQDLLDEEKTHTHASERVYLQLLTLHGLYYNIFAQQTDKVQFRKLWDFNRIIPIVHFCGNVYMHPSDFIIKNCGLMMRSVGNPDTTNYRVGMMKFLDENIAERTKELYLQASVWMVRMESNLGNRLQPKDIIKSRIGLIKEGLSLAEHISLLFRIMLISHVSLKSPLKSTFIVPLCQLCELLKAIQNTFHRKKAMIGESINLMLQQLNTFLQQSFLTTKISLEEDRRIDDRKLDMLAAVGLALQMLSGNASSERRIITRLCMSVFFQKTVLKGVNLDTTKRHLKSLDVLATLQSKIVEYCDTSLLFWNRYIIPPYFTDYIWANPKNAFKIQYIYSAMRDIVPILKTSVHKPPEVLIDNYKKELEQILRENVINKLCVEIESDLRFHIHVHLKVNDRNPFKDRIKDLSPFIRVRPIRLFDSTFNIKQFVEHYLDTIFYNLTTVAQYNWRTYAEMRNLAREMYGLELTESHLPSKTLNQGLDILEVMRKIQTFVSLYNYNLNNQIFIEQSSESKTLNTINVSVVANSIRTHGMGIMNTTVNFTYQFLLKKFSTFYGFLFDDHIKSRLFRDNKFFKEKKEALKNQYPYERADVFNREIKKLGVTKSGLTYLEQFRVLITEIGNAMGFIRMIRSGGHHYIANAIRFVPDLQSIYNFEENSKEAGLSEETIVAAKNLDSVIENLSKNFAEGTDYFKILVNVFAKEFRNPKNAHLQNFFMIFPPLAINYVEHIIRCKDKLEMKKGRDLEMGKFTDDGFALGVAYILKLLDQYELLDTLHWQESVKTYFDEKMKQVQLEMQTAPKEEARAKVVTMEKLNRMKQEFDLFNYCFSGARVFFLFPEEEKKEDNSDDTNNENGGNNNNNGENNNDNNSGGPPPPPPSDDGGFGGGGPPPPPSGGGFSGGGGPPPPPPPPPGF